MHKLEKIFSMLFVPKSAFFALVFFTVFFPTIAIFSRFFPLAYVGLGPCIFFCFFVFMYSLLFLQGFILNRLIKPEIRNWPVEAKCWLAIFALSLVSAFILGYLLLMLTLVGMDIAMDLTGQTFK
mgnify:CR=1 FL=1|tara:strand:+ start:406 stop:780 length:375 start_codon:yes stop_codon:yes gene_type:complete